MRKTTRGITWVKKANKWLYFVCFNEPNKADIKEWLDSFEEAEKKLHEA